MESPSKRASTRPKNPNKKAGGSAAAKRKRAPAAGTGAASARRRQTGATVRRGQSDVLLLEATSSILSERNTIDISLSEIAATSGLNSALISYHFGNKEGLLLALVRRDAERALQQLDELIAMDVSPEQKIRLHIHGIIRTYAEYPYLHRLMHFLLESCSDKTARELANFFIVPLVAAQTSIIEEGVAAGVFRHVDPMYFYYTVVGACDIVFFARSSLENVFGIRELTPDIYRKYADFVADTALLKLKAG